MNLSFIAPLGRFLCFVICVYCLVELYNCNSSVEILFIIFYVLLARLMFVEPLKGIEVMFYFLFFPAAAIAFIYGGALINFGAGMFGVT